jgi:hypothetical protein
MLLVLGRSGYSWPLFCLAGMGGQQLFKQKMVVLLAIFQNHAPCTPAIASPVANALLAGLLLLLFFLSKSPGAL